ncbi:MAG: hypothetical protein BGO01_01330 [Armatimonadetes bacterium 55-13]|nr:carboxypeptidase regulatory-like domain-containing protein [Armatimonadota bacterium]OJU65592.1 MAG: hypothetical protein BGO01_01330 [Armatimonadetes bacterium 55-13]
MKASTTRAAVSTKLIGLLAAAGIAGALMAFGITEEVPLGGLSGKAVMKENGKPLEGVTIQIAPPEDMSHEYVRQRTVETDEDGRFNIRNLPAGTYTVWAYTRAHRLESQLLTIEEGKPTAVELTLMPEDPYLNFNTSQRVFLPSEQSTFQLDGFLPDDEMGIDVYKLDLDGIVKKGSVSELLRSFARYDGTFGDPSKFGSKVRHLDYRITKRDAEGVFVEGVALDPLPEGFYWVQCRSGKVNRGGFINVSKIGLVTKSGAKRGLCFVTDLSTGAPVDGADLSLAVNGGMKSLGKASPDGTLSFDLPDADRNLVMARKGSSVAVVDFYSSSNDDEGAGSGRIFMYSDRPIYKPGDLVQFKGIARKLAGVDFQVPNGGTMTGELRDPDDNLVQTFNLPVSSRGTFSGKFTTNKEAKPGFYTLLMSGPGGKGSMTVNLAAYRKPEFKITVTPEQNFYVFGNRVRMKVKCEYYFGGPVVGAELTAYVSRAPHWSWTDEEGEEYYDESGSGEGIDNLEAVTDDNGEAVIEFDTERPKEDQQYSYYGDSDFDYTMMVSAKEADKYFDGQGRVLVTRGDFAISADTSEYIGQVGSPVDVEVTAVSHIDKKPLSGKQIQIIAGKESWESDKERFSPTETFNATTGPDGVAKITYTPKDSGSVMFKTVAIDDHKNKIETQAYLYVEGSGAPARPGGKLTVQLDKRDYHLGDTVKALIQTDKPGGFALLTVEADEVLYRKVVNLTKSVTIESMMVERPFAPNARVSVAYIRDKQFYEATDDLKIDLVQQKLKIQIKPDRDVLQPGQTVNYEITTTDLEGKPVAADLSLGVVDESIYAIREDDTDPYKGFFPRRYINVQTSYSFPEIYLDGGDKAGGNIPIRSKFADTAYWNPEIHTDVNGQARVAVALPDNLTAWRATVVGATDATAVGISTNLITAQKPLMIRLETPAFMVAQDEQTISAIVQNNTGQDSDVTVRINTSGLSLDGSENQTVRIGNGERKTIEWKATAQKTGVADVTATAEVTNGANDGVKHTIPIKPHGREFQDLESGMVKGTAKFEMVVRDGADANTGRLVLSLSPSIATTLVQSLDSLVEYPYGCVEQTMSRFLPAILVDKALAETGLSRPDLHAKVPGIAADGLARLAKMQHGDGGWGWWEYDNSDPFMTALVLDGLRRAKQAGYPVSEVMLNRGLDWADRRFDSENKKTDRQRDLVYLCYAMATNGRIENATKRFAFDFSNAGASDLALGAMTANMLGPNYVAQRDQLMGKLKAMAVVAGSTARWEPNRYSWGAENTALALTALVKLQPASELIPKTVRYLMSSRRGEYWWSTRDTAYVLIGMTDYLKQTKELARPGGAFTVLLNGKELKKIEFTQASLLQPDLQITVPMSGLTSGKNSIEIQQAGNAVCYYSADLRQVVPDEQLGMVVNGSGLTVERKYYRMEARRMEDGTMQFVPSEKPVTEVHAGDVIKCVLTVRSNKDREFVLVEDPIPSNCHVTERDAPYEDESWGWWWASTVILEDRVSFFARNLETGEKEFSYIMRAEADGKSNALPTRVGNMYDPDDVASAGELELKVNPR